MRNFFQKPIKCHLFLLQLQKMTPKFQLFMGIVQFIIGSVVLTTLIIYSILQYEIHNGTCVSQKQTVLQNNICTKIQSCYKIKGYDCNLPHCDELKTTNTTGACCKGRHICSAEWQECLKLRVMFQIDGQDMEQTFQEPDSFTIWNKSEFSCYFLGDSPDLVTLDKPKHGTQYIVGVIFSLYFAFFACAGLYHIVMVSIHCWKQRVNVDSHVEMV